MTSNSAKRRQRIKEQSKEVANYLNKQPSDELIQQWMDEFYGGTGALASTEETFMAKRAAEWGADQQLELDAKWLDTNALYTQNLTISPSGDALRKTMRPEPPSLKAQALAIIENSEICDHLSIEHAAILRRALEALDD